MSKQLTRDEAVEIVGDAAVYAVEGKNCEPTNRAGYNGACQGDKLTEWAASTKCVDKDGKECMLCVYYYTTEEQAETVEESGGDWASITWTPAHYVVE